MTLHGGRAVVTGRKPGESPYGFRLAAYDAGDTFGPSEAQGFIEISGLSSEIAARRDPQARPDVTRRNQNSFDSRLPGPPRRGGRTSPPLRSSSCEQQQR